MRLLRTRNLTRDLEDTRATLSNVGLFCFNRFEISLYQERERAASVATTDTQHAEIVEKIQQLNLLRESNATLRADPKAHAKQARDLDAKLKGVIEEFDPLRERARTMRAELDARNEHVAQLEEENRRWQERNTQLLIKVCLFICLVRTHTLQYDRVDPTEFQSARARTGIVRRAL